MTTKDAIFVGVTLIAMIAALAILVRLGLQEDKKEEPPSEPLTPKEREKRFEEAISRYRDRGYQVKQVGDYEFQALKPKEFSGCAFLLLLLLGVFPGLFYLLWYGLVSRDKKEVVEVDEYGKVHWQDVAEFGFR